MAVDTEDEARQNLTKRQDTLTSGVGPEPGRRSSSPDIDVVPARAPLEQRLAEIDQRLVVARRASTASTSGWPSSNASAGATATSENA